MNISKRHHFIPVFYLKQFTNPDGFFYIYDVNRDRFKNNGKKFAPSTHFFEHYGNTVHYNFEPSDFVEKSYGNIDSEVSSIIKKINTSDGWILTPHEWTLVQYFISVLYWRNPCNTEELKKYIGSADSLSKFGMKLMDKLTGQKATDTIQLDFLDRLKNDSEFYKLLKPLIAGVTYPESFKNDETDHATIISFPTENLPKLVSDNPIIYRNSSEESLHTDEFIFCITPRHILFRHRLKKIIVHSVIKILADMLTVMQAKDYVSCTDLKYPIQLKELFYKEYKTIENLRSIIFALRFSPDSIPPNFKDLP